MTLGKNEQRWKNKLYYVVQSLSIMQLKILYFYHKNVVELIVLIQVKAGSIYDFNS